MKKYILTVAACAAAFQASATVVEYVDTFGPSLTDFTSTVTLPKFDQSLGDLCAITYTFEGSIEGNASFDSENPQPSIVKVTLGGTLYLKDGLTTLLTLNPSVTSGDIALDGDNDAFPPDFLGTDSGSFSDTASDSDWAAVLPANFAAFIGNAGDTFTWDIDADGTSSLQGSANIFAFFQQQASGTVKIRYEYDCVIPETSTYLTGLGLVGVVAAAGRRLVRR